MRHWLWLTLALAAVLAPGAAFAQDDEEDESAEKSEDDSKKSDDEADESKDDESEASAEADAEVKAEIDLEAKAKKKAKGKKVKAKKKGKKKPPPPPEDEGHGLSAALLGGWGFQPYFHAAVGLRFGGNVTESVYVGGTFLYAFGQTANEIESDITGNEEYDQGNFILFGPEVGYDIDIDSLVLRPYLGLGAALHPLEHCTGGDCESDTKVRMYLAPGAAFLYPMEPFFIGLDLRYNILIALANESAPMLAATAGMWF